MGSRFPERTTSHHRADRRRRSEAFGEWWAAISVIGLASLAVLILAGSRLRPADEPSQPQPVDPRPFVLAALAPAEEALDAVERAFGQLCREPVLLALELEPDCRTGVMTLPDDFFDGFGGTRLRSDVQENVAAAVRTYLDRLRRLPAIWDRLEALEIRGHTDPRAVREPYTTNLVGSQQRALGVLLFLIGPDGVAERDAEDLERLATVSGVSFSRPPASCPEDTRDCYEEWRRVEILPILSEPLRREDWSQTVEEVRSALDRARMETPSAQPR
jgi:outer membrane protein OmpA-like peptidoglycan-associated protein